MTDATFASTDGLRARNKLDKLRRIKDAAQRLFIAKGFDDTTMREIAVRAGVGLGTIFLYAKDKRDLLFLTINEPLEHITQQAEGAVDPAAPLVDNLLAIAKLHYRFFGEQPALARLALREMIFYDSGAQAASFQKTRERLIRLFGHTIELRDGIVVKSCRVNRRCLRVGRYSAFFKSNCDVGCRAMLRISAPV